MELHALDRYGVRGFGAAYLLFVTITGLLGDKILEADSTASMATAGNLVLIELILGVILPVAFAAFVGANLWQRCHGADRYRAERGRERSKDNRMKKRTWLCWYSTYHKRLTRSS